MDLNTPYNLFQQKPFLALDYSSTFTNIPENCLKGCKWSPDGSCLLTSSEDSYLRVLKTPENIISGNFADEKWLMGGWKEDIKPSIIASEKETIFDYTWFPHMNSSDPQSCCFLVSSRGSSAHLWDSLTGKIISRYIAYDHLEQLMTSTSVQFNENGSKIVLGYRKELKIFDTTRPGKKCSTIKPEAHLGPMSCIAFHPRFPKMFAVGSYSGSIGFYSMETSKNFLSIKTGNRGITHLVFSKNGTKLYSGSRKENYIYCWDVRRPGYYLAKYARQVDTNQRIYFDVIGENGQFLITGSTTGDVLVYDEFSDEKTPNFSFNAHKGCTNGISMHPYSPLLATSSGQWKRKKLIIQDSSEEDEDSDSVPNEYTVKLWWMKELQ